MHAVLSAQPESRAPELEVELAGGPVPAHVAIIMDGNGRWGEAHGLTRHAGHRESIEAIRRGVRRVFIIDGRIPHSILIETLTDEGIGTMFT